MTPLHQFSPIGPAPLNSPSFHEKINRPPNGLGGHVEEDEDDLITTFWL